MSSEKNTKKAVIFLDIDGVIMPDRMQEKLSKKITKARQELMSVDMYGELRWRVAQAKYFSKEAIENLKTLLKHIESKGVTPRIVITSMWRDDCTVQEFRDLIFKEHGLSEYIEDATLPEFRVQQEEMEKRCGVLRLIFLKEQNVFTSISANERGFQILLWQNGYGTSSTYTDSKYYIVIDDCVSDVMASLFGSRMIETNMRTLFDDVALKKAIASVDEQILWVN